MTVVRNKFRRCIRSALILYHWDPKNFHKNIFSYVNDEDFSQRYIILVDQRYIFIKTKKSKYKTSFFGKSVNNISTYVFNKICINKLPTMKYKDVRKLKEN